MLPFALPLPHVVDPTRVMQGYEEQLAEYRARVSELESMVGAASGNATGSSGDGHGRKESGDQLAKKEIVALLDWKRTAEQVMSVMDGSLKESQAMNEALLAQTQALVEDRELLAEYIRTSKEQQSQQAPQEESSLRSELEELRHKYMVSLIRQSQLQERLLQGGSNVEELEGAAPAPQATARPVSAPTAGRTESIPVPDDILRVRAWSASQVPLLSAPYPRTPSPCCPPSPPPPRG